jgi:hypothetical protein
MPHRYLVRDGQLKVKESGRQETQHFFLFNDILVHVNSSRLKGGIDLSLPEYNWPINLLWVRERVDKKGKPSGGHEVIGPSLTLQLSKKTEASWVKDIQDGVDKWCQHLNANDEAANNDAHHRRGKFTFPDGGTYDGEWVDGQRQGQGTYSYLGALFEGTWEQGKRNGKGTLFYATGHVYEGEFKADQPNGKGKLTMGKKESVYEGDWADGQQHGKGVYVFPNGDTYEGEFQNGRMTGVGKYKSPTVTYEGLWKDDMYEGKGTLKITSGAIYSGLFSGGLRHGNGQLTLPNGGVYNGEWKDDVRHGKGEFKEADGTIYEGEWRDDLPEGKGTKHYSNGAKYEGHFSKGLRKGQGTMHYKDGSKYEGYWADDRVRVPVDSRFVFLFAYSPLFFSFSALVAELSMVQTGPSTPEIGSTAVARARER